MKKGIRLVRTTLDEVDLAILRSLRDGQMNLYQIYRKIALKLAAMTVVHRAKKLRGYGLVVSHEDGKYYISKEGLKTLQEFHGKWVATLSSTPATGGVGVIESTQAKPSLTDGIVIYDAVQASMRQCVEDGQPMHVEVGSIDGEKYLDSLVKQNQLGAF